MPEPSSEELLFSLLKEALAILGPVDLLTKESIPEIRRALERLDELHSRLGNFHSELIPRHARGRLEAIRGGLRIGDAGEAFRDLQGLVEELEG